MTEFTGYQTGSFFNPPTPYFSGLVAGGVGIGDEVVQIGDRWYLLDLESDRYRIASVPAMKPQSDESGRPGEQTLSNEGLWRRHISSWHHGAGQLWYDRDDANPFQFRDSQGIDPFNRWRLELLHDVTSVVTDVDGWTSMAIGVFTGESRLVVAGNNGRCITIDAALNVTEVTGLTGDTYVASAGATVYVADSTGIYPINAAGTGLGAAFNANLDAAKIWFAKDRLWAAIGAKLYNVIDGTITAAQQHYTHPWPGWEWTSVHEGGGFVYAAGFSGDKGRVYSIGIAEDATTVLPPLVALPLPDGETPLSVHGYVGFVAVGTNEGLRLCQPEGTSLISGPIVGFDLHDDHDHPVRCIEGQDQFLWFGQDSLFADKSGLGRVDLRTFLPDAPLAPAYASDLLAPVSGQVDAVATFDDRRWFVVGNTIYRESDDLVPEGFLDTGRITMNITDFKVAVYIDMRHDALPVGGAIDVYEANAGQGFIARGTSDVVSSERPREVFSTNHNRTVWHELRVRLRQTAEVSPALTALTLAAQPVPDRTFFLFLPLLIHETVEYVDQEFTMDTRAEFDYLTSLARTQQLIRFRQGDLNFLSLVEDFEWVPYMQQRDGKFFTGTMVLKLKTVEVQR